MILFDIPPLCFGISDRSSLDKIEYNFDIISNDTNTERTMSYDRDEARDAWAEHEEERMMEEYYDQQDKEHYECMRELDEEMEREEYLRDLAAKPKYQKDDEYYDVEAALDMKAEAEYKEQIKRYYDELELERMVESEEKHMEWVVNDYYDQHLDELVVDEEKEERK